MPEDDETKSTASGNFTQGTGCTSPMTPEDELSKVWERARSLVSFNSDMVTAMDALVIADLELTSNSDTSRRARSLDPSVITAMDRLSIVNPDLPSNPSTTTNTGAGTGIAHEMDASDQPGTGFTPPNTVAILTISWALQGCMSPFQPAYDLSLPAYWELSDREIARTPFAALMTDRNAPGSKEEQEDQTRGVYNLHHLTNKLAIQERKLWIVFMMTQLLKKKRLVCKMQIGGTEVKVDLQVVYAPTGPVYLVWTVQ